MIAINVYSTIADNDINLLMSSFGGEPIVFSVDSVVNLFEAHPEESDFTFNLNSKGGSVSEGLKIYDKLRTSSKNIFMNIEGGCHSITMLLLLAAPLENRSANKNARALIHQVRAEPTGPKTLNELKDLATQVELEQNTILDIYAERTGQDRQVLSDLMMAEKQRTAEELLQYGFISKINVYTTNKKQETMSATTKQSLLNRILNFGKEVEKLINEDAGQVNYDFKDTAGNVLFTTNNEDESLTIGDGASPDGTFELPTGRKVVIENGAITNILEPVADEPEPDAATAEEVTNLIAKNEKLVNQLTAAMTLINELKNEIKTDVVIPSRTRTPGSTRVTAPTAEELINEAREKRDKAKGRTK